MHPLRQSLAAHSTTPSPSACPAAPISARHEVAYTGPTGAMFALYFKNLFLTLVTLGVYRFWAKTRLRHFLWGHTTIDGEPFEYTGTGKELFVGFMKALVILAPLLGAFKIAELMLRDESVAHRVLGGVRALVILILVYAGTYAARRYRMSRTLWRGIRFEQTGSPWRYAANALVCLLLTALSLGLYFPFMQAHLMRLEMENLRFGSKPFFFTGEGWALLRHYIPLWFITACVVAAPAAIARWFEIDSIDTEDGEVPVTIWSWLVIGVGIAFLLMPLLGPWYRARVYRFQAAHTGFDGLSFSCPKLTGKRLLWLTVSNWLLTIFSLTLLTPLVLQRMQRFWIRHLTIEGDVDFAAVAQTADGLRSGEGLAGFFNIDLS